MSDLKIIVGLGNPGPKYRTTRHNAGFRIIEMLARRMGIEMDSVKFKARMGRGTFSGHKILLARPRTFMNLSGESVGPLVSYFNSDPADLVVIHDDLDLPFGTIRLRPGGGSGGHKGIASIMAHLGTDRFARVRFGIGRPPVGVDPVEYVLTRFAKDEEAGLPDLLDRAAESVEEIVESGLTQAMNRFNGPRSEGEPSAAPGDERDA